MSNFFEDVQLLPAFFSKTRVRTFGPLIVIVCISIVSRFAVRSDILQIGVCLEGFLSQIYSRVLFKIRESLYTLSGVFISIESFCIVK